MGNTMNRKSYIDVLRAFATIGVIVIHVSSNNWYGYIGSMDWIVFSLYQGLVKASVPIFFMISGGLFLNSKQRSIKEIYSHSIFRLLIFLLFWSVIYKLIQFPDNNLSFGANIKNIFTEIIIGNTQTHLWFVYAIIGLYMLIPLLYAVVNHTDRKTLLYIIVVCTLFGTVYDFVSQFAEIGFLANNLNKVKAGFSVGYVGYFLLGAYLDRYEVEKKRRYIIYICGILGCAMTIALVIWDCIHTQTINERFWTYTMPGIYLVSAAAFLAAKNTRFKDGAFLKIMTDISGKSLGIYGIHFVFIIYLWMCGISTFSFTGVLSVPVISAVVFVLSYVSSAIIQKIPICGKFLA